jgi:dihydroflavonol-4-reductase
VARVFVTGGSGFVGGALLRQLGERGDEAVALARSAEAERVLAERGAVPVRGDVLDEASLAAGMAGCELAYHVAGVNTHCPEHPAEQLRVNAQGPPNAVRAAGRAGIRRVVVTSSAATVGEAAGTVGHEDSPHRGTYLSLYERSKTLGEQAAFDAGERLGVEVVTVNPSSVQGPGRSSGTGVFLIAYLNGRLPAFVEVPVSIVDVDDCAEAHLLAAERGGPGRRYVINGTTLPSTEVLRLMGEIAGVEDRVRMLAPGVVRGAAALLEAAFRAAGRRPPICRARVDTILHGHRYDASRSERELGLRYRPLEETLRRIVDWAVADGLVRG